MIIDQGVFDVDPENGLILKEIADGVSMQDLVEDTGCDFQVLVHRIAAKPYACCCYVRSDY